MKKDEKKRNDLNLYRKTILKMTENEIDLFEFLGFEQTQFHITKRIYVIQLYLLELKKKKN